MFMKICLNLLFIVIAIAMVSFSKKPSLSGLWEYAGGINRGRYEGAPVSYKIRRQYDQEHFKALLLEPDTTPQIFQKGDYTLTADSCMETETYSAMPSKLTSITIHYGYTIHHDTLTLAGTLPNGNQVTDYWKKVKK